MLSDPFVTVAGRADSRTAGREQSLHAVGVPAGIEFRVLVLRIVGIEGISYLDTGCVNDGHLARIPVVRYGAIGVLWLCPRTVTYLLIVTQIISRLIISLD